MNSASSRESMLQIALFRILKSLAKLCLRHGFSANAFAEMVRRAYVDAAFESLHSDGKKPLTSRVCAMTGLYRKEVVRLQELPPVEAGEVEDRYNRGARVLTGWIRDSDFCTQAGRPAVLKLDGTDNNFTELVRRYSGDMTPKAVLEELLRTHSVELTRNNSVKLIERGFVPSDQENEMLHILGTDTSDLIETIYHNMLSPASQRNFQRKVSYISIPQKHVDSFRKVSALESQALLEKLDRWLAKRDTDEHEDTSNGFRLGLGIYHFVEQNTPPENSGQNEP